MTDTQDIYTQHRNDRCWLMRGDNMQAMRLLPDASVDSIVSDVPYGLGEPPDAIAMLAAWLSDAGHLEMSGKGFMGKDWDCFVPQPALWRECLRVLKPGGYLLSFAGTRTMDLVGLGLRIAGFEIRDTIRYMGDLYYPAYMYGSGFPKSMDIAKAIDKRLRKRRITIGMRKHAPKFNARAQQYRAKDNGYNRRSDERQEFAVTAPASDEAKQWDGWGTALKPAWEPIIVARKPVEGSTVGNVLAHGVGGINIAACRVGSEPITSNRWSSGAKPFGGGAGGEYTQSVAAGRWPANVIHDGSQAILAEFAAFGESKSTKGTSVRRGESNLDTYSGKWNSRSDIGHEDSGTAARFFYSAKASAVDKSEGLGDDFVVAQYSHDGRQTPIENAYQRNNSVSKNNHPTVKPTALMRWCVRLVTPPGGTCLDMFMGSGSTGKAAMLEGFNFIGIDLDSDGTYLPIATARILHAQHVLAKLPANLGVKRSYQKAARRATPPAAGQMALDLASTPPLPPAPPVAQQTTLMALAEKIDTYNVWLKIRYTPMIIFPDSLRLRGVSFRMRYHVEVAVACIGGACKVVPWPALDAFYYATRGIDE